MARRTNSRRARLPVNALQAQSIVGLPPLFPVGDPLVHRRPLLVTQDARPVLLVGAARLSRHLQSNSASAIDAIEVPVADADAIELIQRLDAAPAPRPSDRARALACLHRHGVGLAQLVECVAGLKYPADASRWIALASADPYLLACLDQGRLSFGHAAPLLPLPQPQQRMWAERCVAAGWSRERLRRRMADAKSEAGQSADRDVSAFAAALEQALGSRVEVDWNPDSGRTVLTAHWYTIEELQGLMDRLARAPAPASALPVRHRRLVIELDGQADVEAATAHLLDAF